MHHKDWDKIRCQLFPSSVESVESVESLTIAHRHWVLDHQSPMKEYDLEATFVHLHGMHI